MTEQTGPRFPSGRFKRMWMDFEVEVVDEMALRASLVSDHFDAEGNDLGPLVPDADQALTMALGMAMAQALQQVGESIGVQFVSAGGPYQRHLDESGGFAELTLPSMPARRDDGGFDGSFSGGWVPPAE